MSCMGRVVKSGEILVSFSRLNQDGKMELNSAVRNCVLYGNTQSFPCQCPHSRWCQSQFQLFLKVVTWSQLFKFESSIYWRDSFQLELISLNYGVTLICKCLGPSPDLQSLYLILFIYQCFPIICSLYSWNVMSGLLHI